MELICDQKPVMMEFTYEEHDLLNSILCHASDGMYIAAPSICELPIDSEIRQRYEMLEEMRDRSCDLWAQRYGN